MSHEHAAQETIERGHAEVRSRRLGILIAVVLVLAIAADRWIFHRPTEQSMLALLGLRGTARRGPPLQPRHSRGRAACGGDHLVRTRRAQC
jgi:hypothetical protein